MHLDPIRRALGSSGLAVARVVPDPVSRRFEDVALRPGRLVEGQQLETIWVGEPQAWPEPLAYLDGVQQSELVGYAGSAPIIVAEIAAAVRERRERRLGTVVEQRRRLALARPSALEAAGAALAHLDLVPLPDHDPPHPLRDLIQAAQIVDQRRGALERAVGEEYRKLSDAWLVIDGALSESPRWAADLRAVAVSRSHSVLPFEGDDLERYLRIPVGHRSSIYQPVTRDLAPIHAWVLRLWPWEGKDLLHGLVRLEIAPAGTSSDAANQISRWMMAERVPVSAPDRRWDRLLYGIHSVGQYLRTRAGEA